MKSIDKFVLVLVASLALLLAGCGGGSSSNEPEDTGPTPEEMAMERAEMQMEAIETASGAVDTALAALDGAMPTQAQIDAVNSAITGLSSALSAAADVSDSAKAGYQAQVSTATTAVMNAESALMAANEKMEMEEQERMAMQAAAERNMARKIFYAIVRDREFDNTGGKATHLRLTRNLKGLAGGLNIDALDLSLSQGIDPDAADQSSTTSTANDQGNSATSNTYQPKSGVGIPVTEMLPDLVVDSDRRWKGNRYVSEHPDDPLTCEFPEGCMKGITDSLVIYHNQADPKDAESQTFAEKYGADSDDDGTLDNTWYRAAVAGGAPAGILNAGLVLEANRSLIMSDGFSTAGMDTHTMVDDEDTDMREDVFTVMGTFDGVPGTYSCTHDSGGACTSSYGDDGVITLAGGGTTGWTFVPNDPNAMTTLGDPTASRMFVTYGYWMRELSGDDGWTDVRPFSEIRQNSVPHANGVAQAIKGSATYTGGAAGMYAIYHPVAAGSGSGEWTANAMLTADFDEQMVSGELTGFMAEGQAMDWKVELLEGDISSATTAPDPASRARNDGGDGGFKLDGSNHGFANAENGTVWTMGDMDGEKTGSWYGDFWAAKGATVDSTAANNPAPAAATGVFWSEYGDTGRMTGAFGVERDDEN